MTSRFVTSNSLQRSRGRPRRTAAAVRTEHVAFRVTPEDHAWLRAQALAAGVTLSELVHARVMAANENAPAAPMPPAANENAPVVADTSAAAFQFELVRQLRAIGVNLNQIARHANTMGILPYDQLEGGLSELSHMLALVDRQIEQLL